jgi:hypothetical protein
LDIGDCRLGIARAPRRREVPRLRHYERDRRRMSDRIRIVSLKADMPTVEEARARLKVAIDRGKTDGTLVLKLIHGYGASGVGGKIKPAIHNSLRRRQKEGQIRAFVPGQHWEPFNEAARQILEACPETARDQDLNRYNEGITMVLL